MAHCASAIDARPAKAQRAPAIAIEDLQFGFGTQSAIFDGFTWTVEQGEMWALLGPSGCGKTTLLYLLAGLQQPDGGQVLVSGRPVPRPRASTGLILQDHGLLPWATVRQNATLGLRMGRLYRNKQRSQEDAMPVRPYPPHLPMDEIDHWLERLSIAHLANSYPAQLSGGQRQRVAIARTLALRPDLLLMDEPFSALDYVIREDLQQLVVDLQRELGITTLIVTHSVDEAAYLGRRILVLGAPPNRTAATLVSVGAGEAGYRQTADYARTVLDLRALLAESGTRTRANRTSTQG